MNAREIKTAVSDLKSLKDDQSILTILKKLEIGVIASESLLRETKVGVAVNKFRSSSNSDISDLVKKMIKSWKDEVKKSKPIKKPINMNPKLANSNSESSFAKNNGNDDDNDKSDTTSKTAATSSAKAAKKTYEGVRNVKSDNIKYEIYDEKTRNSLLAALYNALVKDNKTKSPEEIFDVAKDIETHVFNFASYNTGDTYRSKLRTLVINIKSNNNPELRTKLLLKELTSEKLIKMSPEDMIMFNETLKKQRQKIEEENLFKAKSAVEKRAITDSFICGKCKQRKVTYYQMQTRSADEPLTTFCTCVNCGNHWTFS